MQQHSRILREVRAALPYRSLPRQLYELFEHKLRINTCFRDYYRFRFFDSDLDWDEKALYLGPNGSRYWPWESNSLKHDRLFAVKSIQKSLLQGAGLPTPRLLIKAGRDYPIHQKQQFEDAFALLDKSVVTKFDGGGGGADIFALDKTDEGFVFGNDPVDADWVWSKYANHLDRGFIVEERLDNHPVLDAMHPSSLNTLRLNMIKTGDGQWHLVKPFLKIGQGGSHIDNMSARGLFAGIDSNGITGIGYCRFDDEDYRRHPDTGVEIEGVQIPFFEEACDLAKHAAMSLGYMSTFGWDMAITPDGPSIIEANPAWQFKAVQQRLGPLLDAEIAAGLVPRAWYTPWDRTHMYPNYFRDYGGGWWQRLLARRRRRWRRRFRQASN